MHVIPVLFEDYNAPDWTTVENSEPYGSVNAAVVEICAADGTCGGNADAKNNNWPATLSALFGAGITPLYYISTSFASTPLATIEAQAAQAKTWYGTNIGFMFDEVATNNSAYYQDLYNYVTGTLGYATTLMFNPGTPPPSGAYVFGSHAVLQVFEGSESAFRSATFPSWMRSFPPTDFVATIAGATSATEGTDITDAENDGIDNIFINDEMQVPPPYNTLPSFFSQEVAKVAQAPGV
jgi:hypothetical protein